MIKFFRQLRQSLVQENNMSSPPSTKASAANPPSVKASKKNFKYAIGEIILVVIGILIALQINNWNEIRKQKVEYISNLKAIKENLKSDAGILSSNLKNGKRFNARRKAYMTQDSLKDKSELIGLLGRPNLLLDNSGFETAKGKGTLVHLRNDILKSMLNEYYIVEIERVKKTEQLIIDSSRDLTSYYLTAGNQKEGVSREVIMNGLLLQAPFRQLLDFDLGYRDYILQKFEELLVLNAKLSTTIDSEIKQLQ